MILVGIYYQHEPSKKNTAQKKNAFFCKKVSIKTVNMYKDEEECHQGVYWYREELTFGF